MAKVPKLKRKPISANSRAARRASSPSVNINDANGATKPASDNAGLDQTVLLARLSDGGAKIKKERPMKRQQRLRREKAMEKAFAVSSRLATKVSKSKGKGKTVKSRNATWDDLNESIIDRSKPKSNAILEKRFKPEEGEGENVTDLVLDENMDDVDEEPDPKLAIVFQSYAHEAEAGDDAGLDEIL